MGVGWGEHGSLEKREDPHYLSRKLSLGQSPQCHTLLACPGPSSLRAPGWGWGVCQQFQEKPPPSTMPLTPLGNCHPSEALLPAGHRLAQSNSVPAASTLGSPSYN